MTGERLPHTLILGGPGRGKSTLVAALAAEFGVKVIDLLAARDMQRSDVYETLEELRHSDLLMIDEAHLLPSEIKDLLLGAAGETRKMQRMTERRGRLRTSVDGAVSVANFTLICATTDPGRLGQALLNRLALTIELGAYTEAEIRTICEVLVRTKGLRVSTHGLTLLARAARGVPRKACQLVNLMATFYPDVITRPNEIPELSKQDVRGFLSDHGIDSNFIRPLERRYLAAIHELERPARLQYLTVVLGVDKEYVTREIEPYLMQKAFAEVVPAGRQLTRAGHRLAQELAGPPTVNRESAGSEEAQ